MCKKLQVMFLMIPHFTTALHIFQLIFTVELVETLCNFTLRANPGSLLEYPTFLPRELGKSLHVQEQVQTNWFFNGNSNYKTKHTDDKLAVMCCASMVLVTILVHIFIICACKLYLILCSVQLLASCTYTLPSNCYIINNFILFKILTEYC